MASTAAELAELWGDDGSDSDEDMSVGGAGAADDIALARHSFEVSQQRMRTLGYQESMGQLDEELLQRGFEAGMDAGMSDAEAVGAAQGILAALHSLPPALLPSYGGSGGGGASAPPGKPTDEAVHAAWASVREFGAAHADRSSAAVAVEVADYMSQAADGNDGQDGSGCAEKEAGDGAESAPLSAGERRRCAGGLQARLDGADPLVQSWVRWIAGEGADTAQAGGINTAATCSGRNHSGVEGSAGQGGRLALGLPHRVLLIGGDGQGDSAGASWKSAASGGRHRALGRARMLSSTNSQAEEEAGEGGYLFAVDDASLEGLCSGRVWRRLGVMDTAVADADTTAAADPPPTRVQPLLSSASGASGSEALVLAHCFVAADDVS